VISMMSRNQLFRLGRVVATPGALVTRTAGELAVLLVRHSHRDWGEFDKEDKEANEQALVHAGALCLPTARAMTSSGSSRNGTFGLRFCVPMTTRCPHGALRSSFSELENFGASLSTPPAVS
jgi:hypothetical protein